jgi:putative nucleotidyltransferase with HDIG domain
MSVPNRVEAARLLLSLQPPPWHLRHSRAVAEVAGWLAARILGRDLAVDRELVESAALLHDVDRLLPPDDPACALPHGDAGAAWLTGKGLPELARPVASHPVTRLADGDRYRRWSAFATREERIVAYADKRCGQHLESMAERFASWQVRFPPCDDPVADGGWDRARLVFVRQRAERLEAEVCRAAGVRPDQVRRLGWTSAALRRAKG